MRQAPPVSLTQQKKKTLSALLIHVPASFARQSPGKSRQDASAIARRW
jgi:hypothetical protein